MLRFIRHIRKKMMQKNKLGSYFLYALGEIILVVIGILLALQINTWNEDKKNRKSEISFFNDVMDDLAKDQKELEQLKVFYQNRIDHLGWLLDAIRNPVNDPDIVAFGKHMEPLYYNKVPVKYSSSFDAAQSSGAFSNFQNKQLVKDLTQFYSEYSNVDGILISTLNIIEKQMEPIAATIPENYIFKESSEYVMSSINMDNQAFYDYLHEIGDARQIKPDLASFLAKPEFENYIIGDLGRCFNGLQVFDARINQINQLRTKINNYLHDPSI